MDILEGMSEQLKSFHEARVHLKELAKRLNNTFAIDYDDPSQLLHKGSPTLSSADQPVKSSRMLP